MSHAIESMCMHLQEQENVHNFGHFFRLRNATPYEEEDIESVQSRNVS